MFRIRSLRFRIAAAFIIGTLVVSGLVAGTTYFLVRDRLIEDRVDAVLRQSFSKMQTVKEAVELRDRVHVRELTTLVQGGGDVVVVASKAVAPSSSRFDFDTVPRELKRAVRRGQVGYQFIGGPRRRVVFGSQIPESQPPAQIYFAYSVESVERTLSLMRRIFLGVMGVAALAAGLVGVRLAGATIRPLRLAAEAARGVADGNLETRLEVTGEDELGRLATAFNEMTEALDKRIRRERQFVADVSHELRTPLTSLKTSIDFIADRGDDLPQKLRGPIGLASEEVGSLRRLVDDLLELSRMEAGGVSVERDEVDLVNFANELSRRRAPGANVTVEGPEQLVVRTDKMRLERVIGNLLENAVFHGGGEEVTIELGQSDGQVSVVVTDRGPGIEPEKLPHIFDRFWRGSASRTRDGRGGAGLGLSIARENALVIGAEIDVESEPGRGARFEVRLPRDPD